MADSNIDEIISFRKFKKITAYYVGLKADNMNDTDFI